MESAYHEEIVRVQTEDGLLHEGALITPAGGERRSLAVLCMHGIAGKFYYAPYLTLGHILALHGYTFISCNNRGHDFGFDTFRVTGGDRLLMGSGWERFSESPLDISAWINFAAGLGVEGMVLVGHSYGAFKSTYYAGLHQDARLRGLVIASAPWVIARIKNPQLIGMAQSMVAAGKGQDLLPWGIIPFGPGTLSANACLDAVDLVDVFGQVTPNAPIERVTCPILAMYGTEEPNVGTAAELELIRQGAKSAPSVDTAIVEGMDHGYAGHEQAVADLIVGWIEGVVLKGEVTRNA